MNVVDFEKKKSVDWLEGAAHGRRQALTEVRKYLRHGDSCCRGLPSALRPCNCGLFELLGIVDDNEIQKRMEHSDLGPFPSLESR